ncbi:MAG: hypothetical protein Tsb0014_26690 [Pleurocapsa sp.]
MIKVRSLILRIIAFFLAISFSCFLPIEAKAIDIPSVTNLATLRNLAKESVPYEIAIDNNKPTLLEFYADWCTTCQGMATIVKDLHQQYGDHANLVMLDIDDPKWQKQIEQYRVTGVPQFTFLNSQQQVIKTLIGKVPKTIFVSFFEQFFS